MSTDTLHIERSPRGLARITLVRGEKHNAMNLAMIRELRSAAGTLEADTSIRVVVLAGDGPSFCAGADLTWMQEQAAKAPAARLAEAMELGGMLAALDSLTKPLIARVHGPAYGGGVGLMAVSDIVIAVDTARFALTETRLGLIPATIGPFVVRCLGERGSRRFMLNARTMDAASALAAGLVSAVVSADQLDAAVEAEVAACLACAPGAVADAKALCQQLARSSGVDQSGWTAEQLARRWETAEAREGLACFFERREPSWRRGA